MIPPRFRVKRLAWRSFKGKLLSQKAVGKPSAPLGSKHPNLFAEIPKKDGFFHVWNSSKKYKRMPGYFCLKYLVNIADSYVLRWWHPCFPETIALTLASQSGSNRVVDPESALSAFLCWQTIVEGIWLKKIPLFSNVSNPLQLLTGSSLGSGISSHGTGLEDFPKHQPMLPILPRLGDSNRRLGRSS